MTEAETERGRSTTYTVRSDEDRVVRYDDGGTWVVVGKLGTDVISLGANLGGVVAHKSAFKALQTSEVFEARVITSLADFDRRMNASGWALKAPVWRTSGTKITGFS